MAGRAGRAPRTLAPKAGAPPLPSPFPGRPRPPQACTWRFLAFSGSFNVALSVDEDAAGRTLVFRLVESSFMRGFEGRWRVEAAGGGGGGCCGGGGSGSGGGGGKGSSTGDGACRARIEHVLAVKPLIPIPPAVAKYTQGIFTAQVAGILRDLSREVAARCGGGSMAG